LRLGVARVGTASRAPATSRAATISQPLPRNLPIRKIIDAAGFSRASYRKADEGTRTLDLLHGKETL